MSRRASTAALIACLALACRGASPPAETPPAAPQSVEHADLGLRLAVLPPPFEVVEDSGKTFVLRAPGEAGDGVLVISAGEHEPFGINLIKEVDARKQAFESAPDGRYFGNRELGTPIGTAFTARGAYRGDDGEVEETWVFAIHPAGNRLLTLTYTYPPGESAQRVGQLIEVLGELEALPGAGGATG